MKPENILYIVLVIDMPLKNPGMLLCPDLRSGVIADDTQDDGRLHIKTI